MSACGLQMSNKYNLKITHETLRIAVCDILEELLADAKDGTTCFADIIKWHFLLYFERYIDIVQRHSSVTGRYSNASRLSFISPSAVLCPAVARCTC